MNQLEILEEIKRLTLEVDRLALTGHENEAIAVQAELDNLLEQLPRFKRKRDRSH